MKDQQHAEYELNDIVLLARWLEADGATLREVIYAIEQPHKWRDEISAARVLFGAALDAEVSQ